MQAGVVSTNNAGLVRTHKKGTGTSGHTDKVLKDTELGLLNLSSQACDLAFDPCINLLYLELLLR